MPVSARLPSASCCAAMIILLGLLTPLAAADPTQRPLLDLSRPVSGLALVPGPAQVAVEQNTKGLAVRFRPGAEDYPGIALTPKKGSWDLSQFGHVEMTVINTSRVRGAISLRLDNAGDWKQEPWNSETLHLGPGQKGSVRVTFGYSYGKQAYPLDPARINRILIFADRPQQEQVFLIEKLVVGGKPGETPAAGAR